MKTSKRIGRRSLGFFLAFVMLLSCAFGATGGIVASAETTSTLYLNPNSGKWSDNSTSVKPYTQAAGTTFTLTEQPTRSGFEFIGWQLSGNGGSWNAGTSTYTFGSSSCSLNAQWREVMTTLTLNPNGGTWPDGTTESKQYAQSPGSSCMPGRLTFDGYEFMGWTLDGPSGEGGTWNGNTYVFGNANRTLTAQWNAIPVTLTAKPGYGVWMPYSGTSFASALSLDRTYQGTVGSVVDLSIPYSSQYFHPSGWTLLPGATGTLQNPMRYQFGTSNDTAVPQINPDNYTVSLNPGTGSWSNSSTGSTSGERYLFFDPNYRQMMITVNGESKPAYRLPDSADLSKMDYTFAGWTMTSGTGTVIQQGYNWYYIFNTSSQSDAPTGGARLTAQWTIKQVTLTLQNVPKWTPGTQWALNGGTTRVNAGTTIPLPDASFVNYEGCYFTGWYLDNRYGGLLTPTGSPITSITLHENTELCAGWARNTYTLTLDLNGGYVEVGVPAYYKDGTPQYYANTGEQATTLVPDYSPRVISGEFERPASGYGNLVNNREIMRNGYTFSGWQPSTGFFIGSITENNGIQTYWFGAGDETLIAQWTPITYTLTFDANGGDPVSSMSYTSESTDGLPSATRCGYRFLGWKPIPDDSNNFDFWQAKYIQGITFCWDDEAVYPAGTALTGKYKNLNLQAQWEALPDQVSVTIGDQIGVNLLLNLDARNAETVTVVYKDLNGVQQEETFTDFSALPQVEGGLYKIAVQIAPAQIADTVTVYIDGETLDANVKEYCNTLIAGDYEPEVAALAQAVLDYGQAANNFFDYTDETMSALADLTADDAKAWQSQFSDTTGKIRSVSFMALTKPEFRFYMNMTEKQAAACNAAGVTATFTNSAITDTLRARFVKNTHGDILIEVTGVQAEYLGETIVVTVPGIGTITFAGNDFAKMMAENAATETLGAALYAYGEAAKACFG